MAPKSKNSTTGKKSDKSSQGATTGGAEDKGGKGKVKGAQSLKIRHMLHSKHSDMVAAADRLRNGEDFGQVAGDKNTKSEDKANKGGDLGWKRKGEVVDPFWDAAYALEQSTTAKPVWAEVKTEFGYHLVMVEGRK